MTNHFAALGFEEEPLEPFVERLHLLRAAAEQLDCEAGSYYRWSSPEGAELWLQYSAEGELVGVTPYFAGPGRLRASLIGEVRRPEYSPLTGALHAWATPDSFEASDEHPGAYPFVFDVPDLRLGEPLSFPANAELSVAAFAHRIEVFSTEEEFDAAQAEKEVKYAAESFIPLGLFEASTGKSETPESVAFLTGRIRSARRLSNSHSGRGYYALHVAGFGGEFNVVVAESLLEFLPPVDGIVRTTCFLCGRVLHAETVEAEAADESE